MSTKPEKTQKTPTAKALPITTSCANDPATETPNPAVRKTPLDIKMLAGLAKMTHSLSPTSLSLAGIDWAGHLAFAPGKRLELFSLGLEQMQQLWQTPCPGPPMHSKRRPPSPIAVLPIQPGSSGHST